VLERTFWFPAGKCQAEVERNFVSSTPVMEKPSTKSKLPKLISPPSIQSKSITVKTSQGEDKFNFLSS